MIFSFLGGSSNPNRRATKNTLPSATARRAGVFLFSIGKLRKKNCNFVLKIITPFFL